MALAWSIEFHLPCGRDGNQSNVQNLVQKHDLIHISHQTLLYEVVAFTLVDGTWWISRQFRGANFIPLPVVRNEIKAFASLQGGGENAKRIYHGQFW